MAKTSVRKAGELAAIVRTIGRIYRRAYFGWIGETLVGAYTAFALWQQFTPTSWHPPGLDDVMDLVPWYIVVILFLAVALVATFAGAHGYIREMMEPDLRFESDGVSSWTLRILPRWGETWIHSLNEFTLINESNRKIILRLRVTVLRANGSRSTIPASSECVDPDLSIHSMAGPSPHFPTDIVLNPGDHVHGHTEFLDRVGLGEERDISDLIYSITEAEDIRTQQVWKVSDPFHASDINKDMMLELMERSRVVDTSPDTLRD
jgi:hypothetical protein